VSAPDGKVVPLRPEAPTVDPQPVAAALLVLMDNGDIAIAPPVIGGKRMASQSIVAVRPTAVRDLTAPEVVRACLRIGSRAFDAMAPSKKLEPVAEDAADGPRAEA